MTKQEFKIAFIIFSGIMMLMLGFFFLVVFPKL